MNKGWLELESDPGIFTLLLEDFGVQGVQVEEIYDLQKPLDGPVYGFIFLFKWIEERRSRRKITQEDESFVTDENIVNSMFFAQQLISNSCATHALLSVLLNCPKIKLGRTLTKLKEFTKNMSPEDKGDAIGNLPDLARAHNSHARPEPYRLPEKQQGLSAVRTMETFHFVSYLPISGRLFELDGLKPYPIDHGPWGEHEEWTEKFRHVITERLGMATGGEPYHDIRFNLMAVAPDRRHQYEQKLKILKTNRQIVLEALQQMVKVTSADKPDHIVTRSVAAKEAIQRPEGDSTVASQHSLWQLKEKMTVSEVTDMTCDRDVTVPAPSTSPYSCPPKPPPALDSHNYAKSPIVETEDASAEMVNMDCGSNIDSEPNSLDNTHKGEPNTSEVKIASFERRQLQTMRSSDVKVEIAVSDGKGGSVTMPTTVSNTDVTKPLTIQTKFSTISCGPGSSSTDTASEVGSCMSSPVCSTGQPSPSCYSPQKTRSPADTALALSRMDMAAKLSIVKKNLAVKLETDMVENACMGDGDVRPETTQTQAEMKVEPTEACLQNSSATEKGKEQKNKFGGHHGFSPKDLLSLLKNVESEISVCETSLRDEIEKNRRYKIDDCRRTHNYDQFICTFLSMLAEQGQLAGLVEQHTLIKRRHGSNSGGSRGTGTSTGSGKVKKQDKKKKAKRKR